jgi:response regulator RpfG family c-di-GMP phosphodiesterase
MHTNDDFRPAVSSNEWKVLIVDDDQEIHTVTMITLKRFKFLGKSVKFLNAYSAKEGKEMLSDNSDIAVAFIDVVMEEDDAGLKLIHFIRKELKNQLVKIILRTGQPGFAPERSVVVNYDINDYKEKTELTSQKLTTTLITALRSYQDLYIIECNRHGLKKIVESSSTIFRIQSVQIFTEGVLEQISALLRIESGSFFGQIFNGTADEIENQECRIISSAGKYQGMDGDNLFNNSLTNKHPLELIKEACQKEENIYKDNCFVIYFKTTNGIINIIYFEGIRQLDEWDIQLIEVFASNLTIALENIYLKEELDENQKEVIQTMGEMLEMRSSETSNHVKRVAEIGKVIGRAVNLSENELEILELAAAFHDIGKVVIPDSILNKPGKLTPEEFEIIKQHSATGSAILSKSNRLLFKYGAIIAGQHHEKYDGTGYPKGLKDQEIHLFGRIIAIADVFDALTNNRVYKKAWTFEEAVKYIEKQKGTHFDPVLIDKFMKNIVEIREIFEKYRPMQLPLLSTS